MKAVWAVAVFSLAMPALMLASGCGASDRPPELGDSNGFLNHDPLPPEPCAPEGAVRECHVTLGVHDGILSCFQGTQTCSGGVWGSCGGSGGVSTQSFTGSLRAEQAGGIRVQSLSTPTNCVNNPCDPSCQTYNENPDAGIAPDGSVTVIAITGGSLSTSNVPPGFQNKGNDPNGSCSTCPAGSTSTTCQQACQFDMTCNTNGTNGCTAFGPGQSGSCTGIDITVPVTCENGSNVEVSVCNRGTVSAPPGVNCYVYSGGSPQYPNNSPGLGTPVMTTQTTIAPGACETQAIPDSMFPSGGTESLMCNPPNLVTTTSTAGPSYPTTTVTAGAWVSTSNVYAADGIDSTLSMATTLTSTMTVGNFGFSIPATATITGLTLATKWSVSARNTTAQLGLQAYAGSTAIGTESTTASGSSPPTTDTVFSASPPVTGLTAASFANGTFTMRVRATRASGSASITARVDYVTATVTYTTTTNKQIPECNYNNDWSVSKQNPALACQNVTTGGYAPRTYTQTYTSTCPAGTHTQWAFLAYDATTPSNASGSTDVKFQIQTAPVLVDGGVGAPTAWVTVADTPRASDPAVCPMSGPSPCPKDLYSALGGLPGATNQDLTLQVTLTPSPDSQLAPTLNSWQITYSCPASE
jgi:hypothetical protein